jgi:hypothetical protein
LTTRLGFFARPFKPGRPALLPTFQNIKDIVHSDHIKLTGLFNKRPYIRGYPASVEISFFASFYHK